MERLARCGPLSHGLSRPRHVASCLPGERIASDILSDVKAGVEKMVAEFGRPPGLAAVLVRGVCVACAGNASLMHGTVPLPCGFFLAGGRAARQREVRAFMWLVCGDEVAEAATGWVVAVDVGLRYVAKKKKAATTCGMQSWVHTLPATASEQDVLDLVAKIDNGVCACVYVCVRVRVSMCVCVCVCVCV
jgi:hypothetical protein